MEKDQDAELLKSTFEHLRAPLSTLEHLLRVSVNAIVEPERLAQGAGWGGKPLDCGAPWEEEEREPIKTSLSIVLLLSRSSICYKVFVSEVAPLR